MPTFVLLTKLSTSSFSDPRGRRSAGQDWKRKVEALCPDVRWLAHLALLGPYDFMDVYSAQSEETAFVVSSISREHGASSAASWPALEYERWLDAAVDPVETKAKPRRAARPPAPRSGQARRPVTGRRPR